MAVGSENKVSTVAVVGCGIGRGHIEAYGSHPDRFRVIAVCDVDEKRRAAAGDEFSIARRTSSFDELLRMDDVEIIDICTPPALHVSQILAALAAGKEVVCEKPLAGSLAEVDRVMTAEREAAGRVLPIFQYRFGTGVQKAKRIVDLGIAGKPYLGTVETAWKRTPQYYRTPWRGRLETELGGVLLSQAIHSHDLLTYLMGPVASVFAQTATRVNPVEVEDCAVVSLVMQSGALVSLSATLGSHKEISRLRLCFEHVTFEKLAITLFARRRTVGDYLRFVRGRRPHCRSTGRQSLRSLRVRRVDGRLSCGADDRRLTAGDPRRRASLNRTGHRALPFGGDRLRRNAAPRTRASEIQWMAFLAGVVSAGVPTYHWRAYTKELTWFRSPNWTPFLKRSK